MAMSRKGLNKGRISGTGGGVAGAGEVSRAADGAHAGLQRASRRTPADRVGARCAHPR
jgi:hypothetical protein